MSDDAVIAQLVERVQALEERLDETETENEQMREVLPIVKKHNEQLKDENQELKEDVRELKQKNAALEDTLQKIRAKQQENGSGLSTAFDRIENTEKRITNVQESAGDKIAKLRQRVGKLEEHTNLDSWSNAVSLGGSPLERATEMPDHFRKDELEAPLYRATRLWEDDRWKQYAEHTPRGYVLKSGEVKKLLSVIEGKDVQYTPVYRVMKAFVRNAPGDFEFVKHDKLGKCIIRYHDPSDAGSTPQEEIIDVGEPDLFQEEDA